MEQQDTSVLRANGLSLAGSYLKLILSVLVGAALGLGIYFFLAGKNQAANQHTGTADRLCVCPGCGMTIPRPAGLDCEEVNCPSCGHAMNNAAVLAVAPAGPMGGAAPGTMAHDRLETFGEQWTAVQPKPLGGAAPRPAGFAFAPPLHDESKCVCPSCGKTADHQPGVLCSHMQCPNCQSFMTNSIPIGRHQDMKLVGMGGTGTSPAGAATCPGAGGGTAPPCAPVAGVHQAGTPQAGTPTVTYSNTVKGIVASNCLRCHGGPIRTMNTYAQVKAYADNGLLRMMTQPGGPMSQFLTASESHQISAWIDAGSAP